MQEWSGGSAKHSIGMRDLTKLRRREVERTAESVRNTTTLQMNEGTADAWRGSERLRRRPRRRLQTSEGGQISIRCRREGRERTAESSTKGTRRGRSEGKAKDGSEGRYRNEGRRRSERKGRSKPTGWRRHRRARRRGRRRKRARTNERTEPSATERDGVPARGGRRLAQLARLSAGKGPVTRKRSKPGGPIRQSLMNPREQNGRAGERHCAAGDQ